jgi:hypothetical protein
MLLKALSILLILVLAGLAYFFVVSEYLFVTKTTGLPLSLLTYRGGDTSGDTTATVYQFHISTAQFEKLAPSFKKVVPEGYGYSLFTSLTMTRNPSFAPPEKGKDVLIAKGENGNTAWLAYFDEKSEKLWILISHA